MDLKDFMNHYSKRKEIFDLQERHDSIDSTFNANKNFFSNNHILGIFCICFLYNLIIINNLDYIFDM